jgi:serine/threonine protein kinase
MVRPTQPGATVPGRPPMPTKVEQRTCPGGHGVDPDDLICPVCGQDIENERAIDQEGDDSEIERDHPETEDEERILEDWIVVRDASNLAGSERRVIARNINDGREAIVTIFREGSEPDQDVYSVLRSMNADHVARVYETGRHEGHSYEITEYITGGTLGDLNVNSSDMQVIERIVEEITRALHDFNRVGLRHRDLTPNSISIRSVEPLDLVIEGFGSACLSEFDLDVVSPLETSLYMAPEAIAGGVTASSDWWSLGMILLQKVAPETFEGINEKAFLIQVLTAGIKIPQDLHPRLRSLLAGLLLRDRDMRFGFNEVKSWLDGEEVAAPSEDISEGVTLGPTIDLGNSKIERVMDYALRAAGAENWEEARDQLVSGKLVTWTEQVGLDSRSLAELRTVMRREISDDFKVGIALKILNRNMPFVQKGEIVNPAWLLAFPQEGYDLVMNEPSDILHDLKMEPWIGRLHDRAETVEKRAKLHHIDIDEDMMRIAVLSTSRNRLLALWEERRELFPDTDHPGLAVILDRKQHTEEDLIILLSADIGQFRSIDDVVEEAVQESKRAGVEIDSREYFHQMLTTKTRRDLFGEIVRRTLDFARCGIETIDGWADQFRVERRTTLPRALVMLSIPDDRWKRPEDQVYVSQILKFYAAKVEVQIKQGPLARMKISASSDKIDALELDLKSDFSKALVNKILERSGSSIDIATRRVIEQPILAARIRKLVNKSTLYRRDTGIDGLYMGFPFVVLRVGSQSTRPRISPILLWPVKITAEVGRDNFKVSFDVDREEVRINPALEGYLGPEAFARWRQAAEELLSNVVTVSSTMDEFGLFGKVMAEELQRLPPDTVEPGKGEVLIYPTAVFFHMTFMGQEVIENLRHLTGIPLKGTALETLLRMRTEAKENEIPPTNETERYFVAPIDPSQEEAVVAAREAPGVVISGPPGTGKSQSLVNIVSDCIGRGESVLICCAKQSALDVVRKRLAGEALGDRVMMIEDVNKNRIPVLRHIRTMLDFVLRSEDDFERIQAARKEIAAKIEARESELNTYHAALYEQIGETGRTYRDVVAELVAIEENAETPPIDAPKVRLTVSKMGLSDLVELEEKAASFARLWIDARPNGSKNHSLNMFGWEKALCDRYRADLFALRHVEDDRIKEISEHSESFSVGDTVEATEISARILDAYPIDRPSSANLHQWIEMFNGAEDSPGTQLLKELANAARALATVDTDCHSERFFGTTIKEKKSLLAYMRDKAEVALSSSVFRFINPNWYSAKSKVKRFILQQVGSFSPPMARELYDACGLELDIRDIRVKVANLAEVTAYQGVFQDFTVYELLRSINNFITTMKEVRHFAHITIGIPGRIQLKAALKECSFEALRRYKEILDNSIERRCKEKASEEKLAAMKGWWAEEAMSEFAQLIKAGDDSKYLLRRYEAGASRVEAFQRWRHLLKEAPTEVISFFDQLTSVRSALERVDEETVGDEVRRIINREARLAWRQRAEEKTAALSLTRGEIERKVKALADLDDRMQSFNCRLLREVFERRTLGTEQQWEAITRYQGARAIRLREFMDRGAELGLLKLVPVWMMNPDVAARMLPMKAGIFDVVIFDESSQLPVEYALHVLYRAKRVVISGDAKQMPPTQFFYSRVEEEQTDMEGGIPDEDATEEEREALEREENSRDIKDCTDLLQLASVPLPKHVLQIHYRSRFRELISFSNAAFYNNSLHVPVRHPDSLVKTHKPIEFVQVNGLYCDQTNKDEARAVVEKVAEIWARSAMPPSIGVITFNRKQADLIYTLIEQRAEAETGFRQALSRELARNDDGEDMAFFVMNVENCQGLERDIILFSSTFGRNEQGTFRRMFGVLGQKGGERRLNVAVTRAREKIIFFNSMPIGEISDFLNAQRPPAIARDYLQSYLYFANLMSNGNLEPANVVLSQVLGGGGGNQLNRSVLPDGFGLVVANFIRELGFEPVSARDGTAFAIDYALEHPKTGRFFLGIDCDAPNSPLLAKPRYREIWRPKVLTMGIPRIHRVSSADWYKDRIREKSLLQRAIADAFEEANAA